ncbi:prolyl oligopeptidase family serine peptidase, partial [Klebsiella pneumoniae]
EGGQARMGSTLWEDPQRYIRNSPLFQFDKIETPLLIVQGTLDHLCNDEAGPMYSSLRRLKKEVELVIYDEDYFQGTWSRENLNDYYCRVFEWFERYL